MAFRKLYESVLASIAPSAKDWVDGASFSHLSSCILSCKDAPYLYIVNLEKQQVCDIYCIGYEVATKSGTKAQPNLRGGGMITGAQIRMARAALRLSPEELAHRCGLAYATIWRAESTDEFPAMIVKNLMKIRHELEKAGVIFFDGEVEGLKGTGAGVRLRK